MSQTREWAMWVGGTLEVQDSPVGKKVGIEFDVERCNFVLSRPPRRWLHVNDGYFNPPLQISEFLFKQLWA
jgi:hypothetical protein